MALRLHNSRKGCKALISSGGREEGTPGPRPDHLLRHMGFRACVAKSGVGQELPVAAFLSAVSIMASGPSRPGERRPFGRSPTDSAMGIRLSKSEAVDPPPRPCFGAAFFLRTIPA